MKPKNMPGRKTLRLLRIDRRANGTPPTPALDKRISDMSLRIGAKNRNADGTPRDDVR